MSWPAWPKRYNQYFMENEDGENDADENKQIQNAHAPEEISIHLQNISNKINNFETIWDNNTDRINKNLVYLWQQLEVLRQQLILDKNKQQYEQHFKNN